MYFFLPIFLLTLSPCYRFCQSPLLSSRPGIRTHTKTQRPRRSIQDNSEKTVDLNDESQDNGVDEIHDLNVTELEQVESELLSLRDGLLEEREQSGGEQNTLLRWDMLLSE